MHTRWEQPACPLHAPPSGFAPPSSCPPSSCQDSPTPHDRWSPDSMTRRGGSRDLQPPAAPGAGPGPGSAAVPRGASAPGPLAVVFIGLPFLFHKNQTVGFPPPPPRAILPHVNRISCGDDGTAGPRDHRGPEPRFTIGVTSPLVPVPCLPLPGSSLPAAGPNGSNWRPMEPNGAKKRKKILCPNLPFHPFFRISDFGFRISYFPPRSRRQGGTVTGSALPSDFWV